MEAAAVATADAAAAGGEGWKEEVMRGCEMLRGRGLQGEGAVGEGATRERQA